MNPENDGTAIWLECKFNVPESGQWESESIYSMPLSGVNPQLPPSPGLIVFECTPLDDVTDDLERCASFVYRALFPHTMPQKVSYS